MAPHARVGSSLFRLVSLLGALSLAACGSDASFTLGLSEASVSVVQGEEVSVPLTLQRDGLEEPVDLTVTGQPEGVSATFAANPAQEGTELSLQVAKTAAVGSYPLVVTGKLGELQSTATLTLEVTPRTVELTGRMVDRVGNPVANLPVQIPGKGIVLTNASGQFRMSAVPIPYDLVLVDRSRMSASPAVVVLLGLTRPDPVVIAPLVDIPSQTTTVSGSASGGEGSFPIGSGEKVRAFFTVEGQFGDLSVNGSDGTFSESFYWEGPAEAKGVLRVLHWATDADGNPTSYLGYGALTDLPVTSGVALSGLDVTMDPVGESSITGSVTLAEGSTLVERGVLLDFDDHSVTQLVLDVSGALDFDDAVPDLGGATFDVVTQTQDASGGSCQSILRGSAAGAVGVSVSPPQAPTIRSPADGSPAVTADTSLEWDAPADSVSFLYLSPTTEGAGPFYMLVTKGRTASLPDLTDLGIPFPAGVEYSWGANTYAPVSTVDALAVPQSLLFRPGALFEHPRISRCTSAGRTFTTAP